jgi:hypothetical protein
MRLNRVGATWLTHLCGKWLTGFVAISQCTTQHKRKGDQDSGSTTVVGVSDLPHGHGDAVALRRLLIKA